MPKPASNLDGTKMQFSKRKQVKWIPHDSMETIFTLLGYTKMTWGWWGYPSMNTLLI